MNTNAMRQALWFKVALAVVMLCVGVGVGWELSTIYGKPSSIVPVRESDSGYSLINPLLYTNMPESLSFPKYSALNNAYTQYVMGAATSKKASYVAVYYQDLNTGNWVGINQAERFDPASMLKVAVLIGLLRASEASPAILSSKVNIPASASIPNGADQSYFPPTTPIQAGNTYTIQQLANNLIIQSDDGADAVLTNFLGNAALTTVFNDLHIPLPGTSTGVSAQEYSHLFRVLYNSTYLSSADSQYALELLSQTTFTQGLVAGVPSNTLVAHKFGESLFPPISDQTTWPQATSSASDIPGLSDCGIIYYPAHPYFLCVMTQGSDFTMLAGVIKDLSQITWTQVSALYPKTS